MNKSKGFTLIELMVIAAIIGILAAVAFGEKKSAPDVVPQTVQFQAQ